MRLVSLSAILLLITGQLIGRGELRPILNGVLFLISPRYTVENRVPGVINQIIEEDFPGLKSRCNKVVVIKKIAARHYECAAFINDYMDAIDICVFGDGFSVRVHIPQNARDQISGFYYKNG
jgi:hypothetical protein